MFIVVIGAGIVAGALWYLQLWPFDGSTGLPKRKGPKLIP